MRFFYTLIVTLFLAVPAAQAQDSVFQDYDDYAQFVDGSIMNRDFRPLVLRLGGRDEYTPEQLETTNQQLMNVWPRDFGNVTVFRREDLGGGVSQEGRMYWNGKNYAYFYALLHQRENDMVVITFALNSKVKNVMDRF